MGFFGPDIFGYGVGTEEEEQSDPIAALAEEKYKRQMQAESTARDLTKHMDEERARAELARLRGGQSLPKTNPTPSGGEVSSNPYASQAMMNDFSARVGDAPSRASLLGDTSENRVGRREHPILNFSLGNGPMMAYDPLKEHGGIPDVGKSGRGGVVFGGGGELNVQSQPEEWESRVANPDAFDTYRESVKRPEIEANRARDRALAEHPFAPEQMKAQQAIEAARAPAMAHAQGEQMREDEYMQRSAEITIAKDQDMRKLRSSPIYRSASPQDRAAMEAKTAAPYDHEQAKLDFAMHGKSSEPKGFGI